MVTQTGMGVRALVVLLLVAVALAPAVSRAHLRLSTHPTPAQDNARFKWSNSCERVPSRLADDGVAAIPAIPFVVVVDDSPSSDLRPATDAVHPAFALFSPPALRAPPSISL
jgi:hypothetical protein